MSEKPPTNQGVDPSENVKALSEASSQRQDDLRALTKELFDAKIASLTDTIKAFAAHQRELDKAEAERLNSIRQVDREEVAKTAATNQTATTALANQTSTLAETLRTQVGTVAAAAEARAAAVAAAAENRLNQFSADVIKRLSALELSSSEGKGKQTVSDPQMEKLTTLVEQLARSRATDTGKHEGMSDSVKLLMTILAVMTALMGAYTFTQKGSAASTAPQVIYVPAAAPGTLAPGVAPPVGSR